MLGASPLILAKDKKKKITQKSLNNYAGRRNFKTLQESQYNFYIK